MKRLNQVIKSSISEHLTYLIINLAAISIPLLMTFWSKSHFYGKWKPAILAMLVVAAVFIVWDIIFTAVGIWGFNPRYLTGVNILGLPIEEHLFFFCIPYACVFSYVLVRDIIAKLNINLDQFGVWLNYTLIAFFSLVAIFSFGLTYTFVTAVMFVGFLLTVNYWKATKPAALAFIAYIPLLVPFFIVNGLLTGAATPEPVVWYNDAHNLGVRLITIPIEDMFYGLLLVQANVVLYEVFAYKNKVAKLGSHPLPDSNY